MRTGRKCAYHLCLWRDLGKFLMAGSLIPSASYKCSVATAAIKEKFQCILDTVPLLLVTLERQSHCKPLIAPGVQEECQQLLQIKLPPLLWLWGCAHTALRHRGFPRDQPPVAIPVHPCPHATLGQVQSPRLWYPLEYHCHSLCAGCCGVLLQEGWLYKWPEPAQHLNPPLVWVVVTE